MDKNAHCPLLLQKRVLEVLCRASPLTADEVCDCLPDRPRPEVIGALFNLKRCGRAYCDALNRYGIKISQS